MVGAAPSATRKGPKRGKRTLSDPLRILEREWNDKHSVGTLQFLAVIKSKLHEEEPVLMFNYFGMHRRSVEILRLICLKEHDKFVANFGSQYMPNECWIPSLVILIHRIARGSARSAKNMGMVTGGNDRIVSGIVVSSSAVMESYPKTKGEVACKELRMVCKNKTRLLDDGGKKEAEKDKKFIYWFNLEDVLDPKALASLTTGIPVA